MTKKGLVLTYDLNGQEWSIKEMQEAFENIVKCFEELWKAVKPVILEMNSYCSAVFNDLDYVPKRKEIYRHKYHKIKHMNYKPNYKRRFFCIGNKGNYRRF